MATLQTVCCRVETGSIGIIFFIHLIFYLFIFFVTMKLYSSPFLYFNRLSASYFNFSLAYVSSQPCVFLTSTVRLVQYIFKLADPFILAKQLGQTVCYISPHAHTREKRKQEKKKRKKIAKVRTCCAILFAIPKFLHYSYI